LFALRKLLTPYRGGVLHIHITGPHGGDLVILAAKLAGINAIVRTEHQPLESPPTRMQVVRMRVRDRLLGRVVCVSQQTAEYFIALGRDRRKFVAIPNGVEIHRFVPGEFQPAAVRQELGFAADDQVIGMVSRLHEARKGGMEFVDMAAQIARDFEGARFLVVGDGELRPQLEAQAARLGISDRVRFTGARTDIARLLTALDVFVMPSHWEGGPITVLEAMAMERPVVATNVGMVPDVVDDSVTGCIIPPGDTAALTASVRRLLEEPAVAAQMGRRGREVVLRGFSRDVMTQRISELYAQLSGRG
jgi:glycosyltransferase involved in cell wall biosynthesis